MVNRRQVIKSAAAAATVVAMPKFAFAASASAGFYPAANWIPAKQAMIQVYPRPDSETNTWARHRWAYYDGVNAVQYKIPLGVSFGAFPYVFQLLSGPPGMTIGATYWQSGWSFAQAAAAGYGYLQWTPTASVSGATVSILVTDQQMNTLTITFTVSTSSSTERFIFVDSVHGNDSAGTGTISAPWASFNKAFGSTYSASANAHSLCYFRAGTYAIPAYSDQDINPANALCQINTNTKPSALMGFPGDAPPVFTMTKAMFATGQAANSAMDLFMQGLNPNGYNASEENARFIWVTGNGNGSARITFDNNLWTNSGYGSGGVGNATGYFLDGNSIPLMPYIFINNCSESNRESGHTGNNSAGCVFYGAINALVQGCSLIQPALSIDTAWYFKSDVTNGCTRGCTTIVTNVHYPYSPLQAPLSSMANVEICYNIVVGGGEIALPATSGFTYGELWAYRNNIQSSTAIGGMISNQPNSGGPYVFQSNAVQSTAAQAAGSSVQLTNNLVEGSGLLDSNGNLTAAYASYLGTVGAQIALGSSTATPTAPSNLKIT